MSFNPNNSNANSNDQTSGSQSEFLSGTDISQLKKDSYKTYIYKVLKQVHPDMGVSKEGMDVMSEFCHDVFILIMDEANRLTKLSNKKTLDARDIQSAVSMVIPGELKKHAISEGTKACAKYQASLGL